MKMHKVAIIDDYEDSCYLIAEILSPYFECKYTSNSNEALTLISSFKPDLILLDYKMPNLNGIELLKLLKENSVTQNIPVIFISGEASTDERIETLENGGADFISKPFHPKELILRVQKRILGYSQVEQKASNPQELTIANLRLNLSSRLVYVDSREITLTPKQFEILKMLIENKNNLVSRNSFMEEIWGHSEVTPRNVDSQINYLKKKIEGFQGHITAVPSFGYRLDFK